MKRIVLAAAAALSLAAAAAHAETEGAGALFALRTPGVTVTDPQPHADRGSNAYPDLRNRSATAVTAAGGGPAAAAGSEAGMQTANSLPRGFTAGATAYAETRPTRRAAQAVRPVRAALADTRPRG